MDNNKMEPTLADRFAAIVGEKNAIRTANDIEPFVTERRGLFPGQSELVLKPGSTSEVSQILKLASDTETPVVPQGGNTGLVGAQVPDSSGRAVVLSLSRLNCIREIDTDNNTITVEAGVILQTLQTQADAVDRFFPLSLGSQGSCQIGGNLSSNAGGTGVLAFGNARELCLGVEVVLPTGEVLDDLRKLKKDNTGYDLKNLFVGAEGTLGVITAAVMKLFPKAKGREVAWLALSTPAAALDFFQIALDGAGSALTAFELVERTPFDFALRHINGTINPLAKMHPWYALVEISSNRSAEDAAELMESILAQGLEVGLVLDAAIGGSIAQQEELWRMREALSEAQAPEGASIKHDISVPVASIPKFIERAGQAVAMVAADARIVCFGHMGDGNLHYNVSQPVGADPTEFLALYRTINKPVHDIVRELGGSISAEHGIGQLKRDELLATAPPVGIDLMRRIKSAFDPAGIMNPGKVI